MELVAKSHCIIYLSRSLDMLEVKLGKGSSPFFSIISECPLSMNN